MIAVTTWPLVRLADIVHIERTAIDPTQNTAGTYYVGLEHMDSEGRVLGIELARSDELSSLKFSFRPGQILYGKLRPYLRKIGRPSRAGVCSTEIIPLSPGGKIDSDYLFHYLRHPDVVEAATSRSVGANLPRLSPATLAEFAVPLPPLAEQRRIAAILDKADALRRKRQEAIALTEQLLRSTFLEMFGDPSDAGWPFTTVTKLACGEGAIRTGPFGSQLLHSEFVDEGVAVLGIDNVVENDFRWGERRFITEEKFEVLRRYAVHPGDVLITIMGTCGRCAIVPDDIPAAINTKHLCCITLAPERCTPEFLHAYFLFHPVARTYLAHSAKGAIMDGLNMGIIKDLPVPIVPLNLQLRFGQAARRITLIRRELESHARQSDRLFNSLTHRAFTGQL